MNLSKFILTLIGNAILLQYGLATTTTMAPVSEATTTTMTPVSEATTTTMTPGEKETPPILTEEPTAVPVTKKTVSVSVKPELENTTRSSTMELKTTTTIPTTKSPCYEKCYTYSIKLCGMDGKTYLNPCFLKRAQCEYARKGLDLEIYSRSECPLNFKGKPLPKHCPQQCYKYNLVCGSNGKTYVFGNCTIEQERCKFGSNVTWVSNGRCPPPPTTPDPCGDFSDCKLEPVCTTSYRTFNYGNCSINIYKCKYGRNYIFAYNGVCRPTPNPYADCYKTCPWRNQYVCASDGRTYKNKCYFDKLLCYAKRQGKQNFTLVYEGHCDRPPIDPKQECSNHVSTCPTYRKPVCGSNGETYANTCEFFKAECDMITKGKRLDIYRNGPCKSSQIVG